MARALKVGVLELVAYTEASAWTRLPGMAPVTRRIAGVMPQAVAVWARQMGHHVTYSAWHGQSDPIDLLPDDLDVVFIATGSRGSALAYALARLYRQRRVRTAIGGPHAARFPRDCARFFDVTVTRCDRAVVEEILALEPRPGTVVTSTRPPADYPCLAERLPELEASTFARGRPRAGAVIPLHATSGCAGDGDPPAGGDRCFAVRPAASLAEDLAFVAERFPGTLLGFRDADFGIHLDETLDRLEAVPAARRSRYLMQSSLDLLTPERQRRLAATGCLHAALELRDASTPGRAWPLDAAGGAERLAASLTALRRHVPGLQAKFVLGLDDHAGEEPFAAARAVLRRAPFLWPKIDVVTPWGGTMPYRTAMAEGRLLEAMPLALYGSPFLAMVPRHYAAAEFYDRLAALMEAAVALPATLRRLALPDPLALWLARLSRTVAARRAIAEIRALRDLLRRDAGMRDFHAGRGGDLPAFYARRLARQLGRYRELLAPADLRPLHGEPLALAPRRPARAMPVAQAAE